jgi:hypothetical protein
MDSAREQPRVHVICTLDGRSYRISREDLDRYLVPEGPETAGLTPTALLLDIEPAGDGDVASTGDAQGFVQLPNWPVVDCPPGTRKVMAWGRPICVAESPLTRSGPLRIQNLVLGG